MSKKHSYSKHRQSKHEKRVAEAKRRREADDRLARKAQGQVTR